MTNTHAFKASAAIADAALVVSAGRVTGAGPATVAIGGWTDASDLIGSELATVHPGPAGFVPADRAPHVRDLCGPSGAVTCLWTPVPRDDGATEWRVEPIPTAPEPMHDEPLVSGAAPILSSLPIAVTMLGDDGRFRWASPAARDLLGCNPTGMSWVWFVHPDERSARPAFERRARRLVPGGEAVDHGRVRRVRTDGRVVWIHLWAAAVDLPDGGIGLVHFLDDITDEMDRAESIRRTGVKDPLTAVWHRGEWSRQVDDLLSRVDDVTAYEISMSNFREVNGRFGSETGDIVLCTIASRLVEQFRPDGIVGRVGGDRFAVAVAHPPGDEERQMLHRLTAPVSTGELSRVIPEVRIGVSSTIWRGPATAARLLDDASVAVSRCRDQRLTVCRHDAFAQHRQEQRLRVADRLERALRAEELDVHFQPIVDPAAGYAVVGAEALARLWFTNGVPVSPQTFVEEAVRTGTIDTLGRQVLARAAAASAVAGGGYVAVNVDGSQLHDRRFVELVFETIDAAGLPPERLVLELTETSDLDDAHNAGVRARLHNLARVGIRLALDDFGTGISGLALMQELPLSIVKIDRRFTARLHKEQGADYDLVAHMVQMATAYGMTVVAEGIETATQAAVYDSIGPVLHQGFLYRAPAPRCPVEGERVPPLSG